MTHRSLTILSVLLALFALACSTRREARPAPVAASTGEEAPPPPEDPSDVHLEGDHVTIDERIRFALNSDEILGESSTILDHLAQFLNNHAAEVPALQVIGHTDTQGNARSNQDLSERRAASVVRALEERGVQQRLEAIGRGQTQLLCTEQTEDCHRQNRRVEFIVVQ